MWSDTRALRLVVLTCRLHSSALGELLAALEKTPARVVGIVCARNPRDSSLRHQAANSRLVQRVRQRCVIGGSWKLPRSGRDIAVRKVGGSFDSPCALEAIRQFSPDLLLHVHGPIFRPPTLAAAGLGLLNCHMGWLPLFRGMNALEWSVLYGYPTGNTVHFVDSGIDTGDIVGFYPVPIDACRSLAEARDRLVQENAGHLARAVTVIAQGVDCGYPQSLGAGRQHYRMHGLLRGRVDAAIASGYRPWESVDKLPYVMAI